MAATGVELALGVVGDPQFGPLVMVAAGGVLVEALGDRRFMLPPVDARTAGRLPGRRRPGRAAARLSRCRAASGRRGQPWTRSPVRLRNCCTPAARHTAAASASAASDQAMLAAQPSITSVRIASIA
jgi:hypothetical protein